MAAKEEANLSRSTGLLNNNGWISRSGIDFKISRNVSDSSTRRRQNKGITQLLPTSSEKWSKKELLRLMIMVKFRYQE